MIRFLLILSLSTLNSFAMDDLYLEHMLKSSTDFLGNRSSINFCEEIKGNWVGSCELTEAGSSSLQTFPHEFKAGTNSNCANIIIGADWINTTDMNTTSYVSPNHKNNPGSSMSTQTTRYWNWSSDRESLQFNARVTKRKNFATQVTESVVTGRVSIVGGKLIRKFAFSDSKREMNCSYEKRSTAVSENPRGSLVAFLDESKHVSKPPALGTCQDFTGHWKGKCHYIDESRTDEWESEDVVLQDNCQAIRRDGEWIEMGAVRTRHFIYSLPENEKLFTDSSSWQWNKDRTRLEYTGVEVNLNFLTGKKDEMKTPASLAIENGKLISHRLSHGTCLFHCVYERH